MTRLPTNRRKTLWFVVTEGWYFVSHRLALAVAAKNAGFDVAVITRQGKHDDQIRQAGIRLIPIDIARSGMNPIRDVLLIIRLGAIYRRGRPDIVHHVAMKPVLYGTIAATMSGTPQVINALAGMGWLFSSRSAAVRLVRPLVRFILGRLLRAGFVIVQNPDDLLLAMQMGVPVSKVRLIPGAGVELERFAPSKEPAGTPVILLPSRLLWEKGIGEFVAAARILRRANVNARFVLAGVPDEGNPTSISSAQLAEWVKEGVVEYHGWVDDMPKAFADCHVVCLPSYREGMPKSLLEAAAAGRVIITTEVPGCKEIVHHRDNGLLVPAQDPIALARALEEVIKDPVLRRRMGARGRERAVREFSLAESIRLTLSLYGATHH